MAMSRANMGSQVTKPKGKRTSRRIPRKKGQPARSKNTVTSILMKTHGVQYMG